MSALCPKCHIPLKDNALFCSKCGAKVGPETLAPAQAPAPKAMSVPSSQSRQAVSQAAAPLPPLKTSPTPQTAPASVTAKGHLPMKFIGGQALVLIVGLIIKSLVSSAGSPPTPRVTALPFVGAYVHRNGAELKTLTFFADGHLIYSISDAPGTQTLWYRRGSDFPIGVTVYPTQETSGAYSLNLAISDDQRVLTNTSSGAKYTRQ